MVQLEGKSHAHLNDLEGVAVVCLNHLEIKKKSPFKHTFVIELANGSYGYLPTPKHHELGGYETWLGTNKVQKDGSDLLTRNLLEMLNELHSGKDK